MSDVNVSRMHAVWWLSAALLLASVFAAIASRDVVGANPLFHGHGHRSHFHGFVPTEYQSKLMPLIRNLAQIHAV